MKLIIQSVHVIEGGVKDCSIAFKKSSKEHSQLLKINLVQVQ